MEDTELEIADLDALLAPVPLPEKLVPLPRLGRAVRVRGLTRAEAHILQGIDGSKATECHALAMGMVAPTMTVKQVAAWMTTAPAGEISEVADEITRLSGMMPGDDKSGLHGTGDEPDTGVRVLPSDEAGARNGGQPTIEDEQ